MTFRNSVVGGVTLVRPAIRSPNYVTGVSGWSIDRNGSAEFNNVVIRGTTGNAVEIGPSNGAQVIIRTSGGAGVIEFPTHRASELVTGRIIAGVNNANTPTENLVLQFRGPAVDGATDFLTLGLFSQNDDGSSNASLTLQHSVSGDLFFINEERVSFRPTTTTAASRYFRINAPSGASASAELIQTQVNASDRFNVKTTGSTTITQVGNDAAVPMQIIAESTQTGDLIAAQVGASPRFNLSAAGDISIPGNITISGVDLGRGIQSFVQISASVSGIGAGTETVLMTIPSMTFKDGRCYRITFNGLQQSNSASDRFLYRIRKGSATTSGTIYVDQIRANCTATASINNAINPQYILKNQSGADITTALTITGNPAAGTGIFDSPVSNRSCAYVEDVGPESQWPGIAIS